IYGDNTYRNIQRDPRVSMTMHWRDSATGISRSYQVNAIAEIFEPGTTFFRYMRVLRSLFSSRFVETRREGYVAAYKFWISESHDKSLESKTGFVPSN
ncbi:MAG: pyridoxamine 5'-phosphate oxidase family protein, partial [Candidatus Thorarchaeota archaeon]|nr:pyridoxamine 5'-phosphate oxidase family protein [Candidatus Thorarchaeota archaeon]